MTHPQTVAMSASTLSNRETYVLLSFSVACGAALYLFVADLSNDPEPIFILIALSGLGFVAAFCLLRWCGDVFRGVGLKGRDMGKANKPELPEAMGAVCAVVWLVLSMMFIPFSFYRDFVAARVENGKIMPENNVAMGRHLHLFPHSKLASSLSGLLSLQSIILLGIADDLLDIRWRHKVLIPAFASLPVLIVYFVDYGVTRIVLPLPLQAYLGRETLDLGWVYYVHMAAVSIFCPNSINMLAGINGVEVSQSLVIAALLLVNDALYLVPWSLQNSSRNPAIDSHLSSTYYLIPFIAVSLALWWQNRYPASVFVGDTYCYFAGMVFAVVGILGHFSKTLMLLFVPQIFNFFLSCPQLFNLLPCPRHRLPKFDETSQLMFPSTTDIEQPLHPLVSTALEILDYLHIVRVTRDLKSKQIVKTTNLTLLNMWLSMFGPMRESVLAGQIAMLQVVCGVVGLIARHSLALYVFAQDNTPWDLGLSAGIASKS